jgi:serine/threonine protein kinase, bacterial
MNDNKAILISAAIVAGAIVLSSVLILTRDNVPQSSSVVSKPSPTATPIDADPVTATLPSTTPEPVATPSNLPIPSVVPSIESKPYTAPASKPQPLPIPSPIVSVRPIPSVKKNDSPAQVNIQRPATDSFIQSYYSKLQSAQYQSAWQDLSGDFQGNRSANPGGYEGEYLKWWSSFGKQTKVKKIETMKITPDRATVRAHCQFNGKSYIAQYYLKFDTSSGAWKIYGIDKLS